MKSYPSTAWKPWVPHPTLVPSVTSFKTSSLRYKTGLTKPTGPLPTVARSSFIYAARTHVSKEVIQRVIGVKVKYAPKSKPKRKAAKPNSTHRNGKGYHPGRRGNELR